MGAILDALASWAVMDLSLSGDMCLKHLRKETIFEVRNQSSEGWLAYSEEYTSGSAALGLAISDLFDQ